MYNSLLMVDQDQLQWKYLKLMLLQLRLHRQIYLQLKQQHLFLQVGCSEVMFNVHLPF